MAPDSRDLFKRVGILPYQTALTERAAIAVNVRGAMQPLNGLRHPTVGDFSGWYIWAGEEFSTELDFFDTHHLWHVVEWRPEILTYLELPPGWRFLIAEGYEDVWFDEALLDV